MGPILPQGRAFLGLSCRIHCAIVLMRKQLRRAEEEFPSSLDDGAMLVLLDLRCE